MKIDGGSFLFSSKKWDLFISLKRKHSPSEVLHHAGDAVRMQLGLQPCGIRQQMQHVCQAARADEVVGKVLWCVQAAKQVLGSQRKGLIVMTDDSRCSMSVRRHAPMRWWAKFCGAHRQRKEVECDDM